MPSRLRKWSLAFFICLACTSTNSQTRYPYKMNLQVSLFGEKFVPVDLENEGTDALLRLIRDDEYKDFVDLRKVAVDQIINQKNYPGCRISDIGSVHRSPDGAIRLCVTYKKGMSAFLDVLDDTLGTVTTVPICRGQDINADGVWDADVILCKPVDLNQDGCKDIPIRVGSNLDKRPRGMWVVCGQTHQMLWHFKMGSHIRHYAFGDVDLDGDVEIFLGTSATSNGVEVNDISDDKSYIIGLDHTGQCNWKYITGYKSASTNLLVQDLNNSGKPVLVTLTNHQNPERHISGQLTLWNPQTRIQIKNIQEPRLAFTGLWRVDANNDRQWDIVIGVNYGNRRGLRIYDSRLNLLHEFKEGISAGRIVVVDLNQDGEQEIVVIDWPHQKTHIFNSKYQKIGELDKAGLPEFIQQGFGRPPLLSLWVETEKRLYTYSMVRTPLLERYPLRTIVNWVLICILGLLALAWIVLGQYPWLHPRLRHWATQNNGFWLSSARAGRLISRNQYLFDQLRAWQLMDENQLIAPFLAAMKRANNRSFYYKLEDGAILVIAIWRFTRLFEGTVYFISIKELSKEMTTFNSDTWPAMARKLAHELKNPLSTLLLTQQRLQMAYHEDNAPNKYKYDEYANSSMEEIRRLRRVSDGFMKYMQIKPPEKVSISVKKLLEIVVKQLKAGLPEYIQFTLEAEKELGWIDADRDQMQALFFNLFDNAVKAMPENGRLELRAIRIEKSDEQDLTTWIRFEISDTGIGIDPEIMEEIFEPFSSFRKDGTGLGLSIVRQITEQHSGAISLKSKPGIGTTAIVELPDSQTTNEILVHTGDENGNAMPDAPASRLKKDS
ncbi:HAMP domain-containing histidine kinase [bacterium]|nr:HAMP domain-containing histidine kinase [bacterium]